MNIEFPITPYQSVGPIKLGMKPEEVREAMNSSIVTADYFDKYEISVHYNELNQCSSVLLRPRANPTFRGKNLLNSSSFEKLYQWFKSIDESTILGDIQLVSFEFGISLSTPCIETHGKKRPKDVTIFEEGFFDYLKTSALIAQERKEHKLTF
jgi:hypothetical protein